MNLFQRNGHSIPSTQDHLLVREIRDGLLVLRDQTLVAVVRVWPRELSPVMEEAETQVLQYREVLRNLRFPFQILITTHEQDLSAYLARLDKIAEQHRAAGRVRWATLLEEQMIFLRSLARRAGAQVHSYYLAFPYADPLAMARRAVKRVRELSPTERQHIQQELDERTHAVIAQLQRAGLTSRRLDDEELIALFRDFYRPDLTGAPIDLHTMSRSFLPEDEELHWDG